MPKQQRERQYKGKRIGAPHDAQTLSTRFIHHTIRGADHQSYSAEGVRIVEVDQFDYIPCGGTHCARTGEVGSIRVSSWRKRKKNEWEIRFLCGKRALADYQQKRFTLHTLQQALKVPEDKVNSQVLELMSELLALRRLR